MVECVVFSLKIPLVKTLKIKINTPEMDTEIANELEGYGINASAEILAKCMLHSSTVIKLHIYFEIFF